jgi:hypothetical protein
MRFWKSSPDDDLGSLPMYGKRHVLKVPLQGGVEGSEVGLNEILSRIQIQNSLCILESDFITGDFIKFSIRLDDTIVIAFDMRKYVYLSVIPLTMR